MRGALSLPVPDGALPLAAEERLNDTAQQSAHHQYPGRQGDPYCDVGQGVQRREVRGEGEAVAGDGVHAEGEDDAPLHRVIADGVAAQVARIPQGQTTFFTYNFYDFS